IIISKPLKWSL
ncbi:hypothetical protein quinque_015750, partial [Culex quinquefasciatus]